jgi:hypothetical protein
MYVQKELQAGLLKSGIHLEHQSAQSPDFNANDIAILHTLQVRSFWPEVQDRQTHREKMFTLYMIWVKTFFDPVLFSAHKLYRIFEWKKANMRAVLAAKGAHVKETHFGIRNEFKEKFKPRHKLNKPSSRAARKEKSE